MEHGNTEHDDEHAQNGQRVRVHGDVRPEEKADSREDVLYSDGQQSLAEEFIERLPQVGIVHCGRDAESIERIGFDLLRGKRKREQGEDDSADNIHEEKSLHYQTFSFHQNEPTPMIARTME